MNRVLVIHLKRFGDLVSAGQFIGTLRAEHPHAEINLLCFEEFSSVAKLIPGLKKTFTINRNALMTLKGGKLYNNGFAVDEFHKRLELVAEQKWDRVINLTNDRMSAYICSWLQGNNTSLKITGMNVDTFGIARASNSWSMVFNDVLPRSATNAPFNFRDVWSQMVGSNDVGVSGMLTNARNEATVAQHFATLRERGGKVIGIQATCSVADKGFSRSVVCELATELANSGHHPLLLIAANDSEREYAHEILNNLEFKPIVVESDFTALSSVVKNLDLLITPDTVTKHFADAHGTSCLEVSLGSSPVFKQATINPASRMLVANKRDNVQVSSSDIITTAMAMLSGTEPTITDDAVLYRPQQVCGVTSYLAVSGHTYARDEFDRHAMTALMLKTLNQNNESESRFARIALDSHGSKDNFAPWATASKDEATTVMKDLLHAIRSLLQMRENPRRSGEFVAALDRLFAYTDTLTPATLGVHFFRARVESLPPANFTENTRAIEALLFELKADLQNVLGLVNEWEKIWAASKFSHRKNRSEQVVV